MFSLYSEFETRLTCGSFTGYAFHGYWPRPGVSWYHSCIVTAWSNKGILYLSHYIVHKKKKKMAALPCLFVLMPWPTHGRFAFRIHRNDDLRPNGVKRCFFIFLVNSFFSFFFLCIFKLFSRDETSFCRETCTNNASENANFAVIRVRAHIYYVCHWKWRKIVYTIFRLIMNQ